MRARKGIPKIIHFVWIGDAKMPPFAVEIMDRFHALNPCWKIMVHGDDACAPEFADLYERAPMINRTDLLRYSVVRRYGGYYFDLDHYPFRPCADIQHAYDLGDERVLVSEQAGQRDKSLTHNSTPIIGAAKAPLWPVLVDYVLAHAEPFSWISTGPRIITGLVQEHPELFEVAQWPWFYPAGIGTAGVYWRTCQRRGAAHMRRIVPTAGQLPFAMHLWAKGGSIPISGLGKAVTELEPDPKCKNPLGLHAVLSCLDLQWADETQPFKAVAEGLQRIGCRVDVRALTDTEVIPATDVLVVWNGRRGHYRPPLDAARRACVPTVLMEHGFFDRRAWTHIDHKDILHWTSWARDWDKPAPAAGAERLAAAWPFPLRQMMRHRRGYVLVLGQVSGDAQMQESEVRDPLPLCKLVARSLPSGVHGMFRPHPSVRKARWLGEYLPTCEARTLVEAIEGAALVVTINSNAGNEALALGCPVLCLGPAMYAEAGVAARTTADGMRKALGRLLSDHQDIPSTERVRNYLHWLACRQHSQEEFRDGAVLRRVILAALGRGAFDGT